MSIEVSSAAVPHVLWQYYLQYLWHFSPDSWVAKVAYTFRVLAIILILPLLILALLDIAAYGIARTLGVVDDVKASTSDKASIHPIIHINEPSSPSSLSTPTDSDRSDSSTIPAFFISEPNNLQLSGVDVLSPAPSQPPSPTLSRRKLQADFGPLAPTSVANEDEGLGLRRKFKKAVET